MKQADPRAEHELMLLKGGTELFPAMVETYAILALLISILAVSAINV